MKLHHYAMIFLVIIFSGLALYVVRNYSLRQTYKDSAKCEFELTASLLDAMTKAVDKVDSNGNIFASDKQRRDAYDTFYATLSLNLNQFLTKDTYIQDTIPCLFLVDTNGYYVVYRETDTTNTLRTVISPLNTWGEYIGNGSLIIQYYLRDYVTIIDRVTGKEYSGRLSDVREEISADEALNPSLGISVHTNSYISSYATYSAHRETFVWSVMEEQINYYVNKYNVNSQYVYDLTIPMTTGIQEGHTIDRPCMYALMQGEYLGLAGTEANVYAYAQSEIIDSKIYYCSGEYYHEKGCPNIGTVEYKGSMKNCAKHDYYPCPDCVK